MISRRLLASFPVAEKKQIDRSRNRGEHLLSLQGVASPSLLNYSRAGLDPIRGQVFTLVGPHELGVHDSGGACDLSCA
jgi:hypothetical protein